MEQQRLTTSLAIMVLLAVAAASFGGAVAQLSSTCQTALVSLSPCLDYITGNSSTPSSSCCKQLATVVQSQPLCLCQALNGGGSSFGISVNQTQAMALPSACNVTTPAISQCNTTAASPTGSSGAPSTVPAGSSGNSVPASDGVAMKMSVPGLVSLLLAVSFGSAFVLV